MASSDPIKAMNPVPVDLWSLVEELCAQSAEVDPLPQDVPRRIEIDRDQISVVLRAIIDDVVAEGRRGRVAARGLVTVARRAFICVTVADFALPEPSSPGATGVLPTAAMRAVTSEELAEPLREARRLVEALGGRLGALGDDAGGRGYWFTLDAPLAASATRRETAQA